MSPSEPKPRVVVVGAGPGGYAAAFLAADLDMAVTLVDPERVPGGVCLHRGCIPSKALLHVAHTLSEAERAGAWGVDFGKPAIDLGRLRTWKEEVVAKLTGGLDDVPYPERPKHKNQYSSGKICQRTLQGKTDGKAGRTQYGYKRCGLNTKFSKGGQDGKGQNQDISQTANK